MAGLFSGKELNEIKSVRDIKKNKTIFLINDIINRLDNDLNCQEITVYTLEKIYTGRLPINKVGEYIKSCIRRVSPEHIKIAIRYLQTKGFKAKIMLFPIIEDGSVVESCYEVKLVISC